MKRWLWILVLVLVVGAVISWRAFSMRVVHHPDITVTPELVQRGEYLARAGDCVSCHTAPGGQPFAGGRLFDLGEMGRLYSPNITPDRDTGIGSWSDDDFRAALQLGIGKGGTHLYPAFPYASFTLVSDEDALAIKAYLFSLKPVHNVAPANAMRFPYDQRFLMAYWSWLFDPNERLAADPGKPADWNRGRYLVEGLGHCGECHTGRNLLQARESSKAYAGAITQNWKAYDISPDHDTGIGGWSDQDLESYLSSGFAQGHGPASGPMAEAIVNSLHYLTAQDIHSMVVYLRSLTPRPSAVPVSASADAGATGLNLDYGRQVYARECANCHQLNGMGTQSRYESLYGSHSVADRNAVNLTQVVLYGSSLDDIAGRVSMPGFGKGLTNTEIAAVVNFAAGRLGGHPASLTPADVAARR
jgi:mono/diheme cytochrome c family protein